MPMTMAQKLGLLDYEEPGQIDPKRKDVQKAFDRARMYQYIQDSLKNIQSERGKKPETFLSNIKNPFTGNRVFGAGNETGPDIIDPEDFQIASEENPTKQGGFDEAMTWLASKISPKGVKQKSDLYSSISSLSPAAFERTGATMPAAERMTAMAEFQPDPSKDPIQFDQKIKYGSETLLPMRVNEVRKQLESSGASPENVSKYLQTMGLLFDK